MSLACKTTDLLALATHALKQLMSGQHALQSADARSAALAQLATTVQAAAMLAELARAEVLGGNTGSVSLDMEAQKVETERIKAETERSIAETARLHAETDKVAGETERAKAEAQKAGKEAEKAVAETERLKAEAMAARSEKMKIDAETERVKADTERTRRGAETQGMKVDMESDAGAEADAEKASKELAGATADGALDTVDAKTLRRELESRVSVHKVEGEKPYDKLLSLEAEIERTRIAALRVTQLGDQFAIVSRLAREMKELENEARLERQRRRSLLVRRHYPLDSESEW